MNILILNWKDIKNPEVGGAEIIAYELSKRLVTDGCKVTWFAREFPGCSQEDDIEAVKVVRRGSKLTTYIHAYRFYQELQPKPDIVIDMINTICWQTPCYVRARHIAYVNQLAQEVFLYELPFPLSYIGYFFEPWQYLTYRKTSFACYSESTKQDLMSLGIPVENIRLFPLGIDHNRYYPGEKENYPLFIFVARLTESKRADLCVRAMKHVLVKAPDARLAILGFGAQKSALKKLIEEEGLEESVSVVDKDVLFFEKVERDQKVELLRKAWALLLPSVKEGWGMVITEANACGTPAIVSNVTGLRDSVRHGETGIILSKDPSPSELAEAMLRIIEDKPFQEALSSQAIKWAGNFTWEKSYRAFKEIIESV